MKKFIVMTIILVPLVSSCAMNRGQAAKEVASAEKLSAARVAVMARSRLVEKNPIFAAIDKGDPIEVAVLLSKGADANAISAWGETPLHRAAMWKKNGLIAGLLLSKGANVNARNKVGMTPLHLAAVMGHDDMVEVLLANGAQINARDHQDKIPLHEAMMTGKV